MKVENMIWSLIIFYILFFSKRQRTAFICVHAYLITGVFFSTSPLIFWWVGGCHLVRSLEVSACFTKRTFLIQGISLIP